MILTEVRDPAGIQKLGVPSTVASGVPCGFKPQDAYGLFSINT
jgi:hypothetical protein